MVIRILSISFIALALFAAAPVLAADPPKLADTKAVGAPKHGGTLTYMIPADAPPTFDGHRETTFATGTAARLGVRVQEGTFRLVDR